jgi:cytochrome oxidase Cu insertion factor (SCO1/SenC/PrrC family)
VTTSDAMLGAELERRSRESGCCGPDRGLLSLLREDATIYGDRGTVEAERLRAFVMECVTRAGLAQDALPYILEELETGTDPYPVAAAARAVRHLTALPLETAALLIRAIERIRHADEFVCLDRYPAPQDTSTTSALMELRETLAVISREGSLTSRTAAEALPTRQAVASLRDVELEDQDGNRCTFGRRFGGRVSLLAFFYTRCMNPDKCSRTVSKLGAVHELVSGSGAVVAGITYDPAYDLPERLRRYGSDRGVRFGPNCYLLRTTGSFAPVRDALQLRVGYGTATVNRHRVELLLINAAGNAVDFKVRRLWDERDVADQVLAAF